MDDELEIVIVKDMMLTGYDSPPLHTLYLTADSRVLSSCRRWPGSTAPSGRRMPGFWWVRPTGGQPAKGVVRVHAARPGEQAAGPGGEGRGRAGPPVVAKIDLMLSGYNWRVMIDPGRKKSFVNACNRRRRLPAGSVDARQPGRRGEETLSAQFRRRVRPIGRAWALSTGSDELAPLRPGAVLRRSPGLHGQVRRC